MGRGRKVRQGESAGEARGREDNGVINERWEEEEGEGRRGEDLFGFVILTLCEIFFGSINFQFL